jgi:hypothetical protein
MRKSWRMGGLAMAAAVGLALLGAGCNTSENKPEAAKDKKAPEDMAKHEGWWCKEHGMPEKICVQCDPNLAAAYKKKGDWCKEHERPESQCFVCHPDLKEKFAEEYRAKYGKEPPPIEEETK